LLEIALAAGNYLNSGGKNPKGPAQGIRLQSLLKMNEVVSQKNKVSLLNFIVRQLDNKNINILTFTDEVPNVAFAVGAISQFQVEIKSLQKGLQELKTEAQALKTAKGNPQLITALETSVNRTSKELESMEGALAQIEKEVLYFGEQDVNDIAGFFTTWLKFLQNVQSTVKQLQQQKKRQQEEAVREATKKKKEEEAKAKKVTRVGFAKDKTKEDGVVDQISKTLKTPEAFSKLRGYREIKEEKGDKQEATKSLSESARLSTGATTTAPNRKSAGSRKSGGLRKSITKTPQNVELRSIEQKSTTSQKSATKPSATTITSDPKPVVKGSPQVHKANKPEPKVSAAEKVPEKPQAKSVAAAAKPKPASKPKPKLTGTIDIVVDEIIGGMTGATINRPKPAPKPDESTINLQPIQKGRISIRWN